VKSFSANRWNPAGSFGFPPGGGGGGGGGGAFACTESTDCPLLPSLVAVVVTKPAATPVTRPVALTVANAALLLAHVIVRPVNGLPLASLSVAVSCTVCPTATLAAAGLPAPVAPFRTCTLVEPEALLCMLVAVTRKSPDAVDRKSTRLNPSHQIISYA